MVQDPDTAVAVGEPIEQCKGVFFDAVIIDDEQLQIEIFGPVQDPVGALREKIFSVASRNDYGHQRLRCWNRPNDTNGARHERRRLQNRLLVPSRVEMIAHGTMSSGNIPKSL